MVPPTTISWVTAGSNALPRGLYQQLTPSPGGSPDACVDETAPNLTDCVGGANVGDKDTYDFQNLSPIAATNYGVQVATAAWKDAAGARSIANTCRSGSIDADGPTQTLSTGEVYCLSIHETDPATSLAWTEQVSTPRGSASR